MNAPASSMASAPERLPLDPERGRHEAADRDSADSIRQRTARCAGAVASVAPRACSAAAPDRAHRSLDGHSGIGARARPPISPALDATAGAAGTGTPFAHRNP